MGCHVPCQTDYRSVEAAEFRLAMRNLASGVAIVATGTDKARRGLTVSSVTSLCMEPPCLLVGINTNSETHDAILTNGSFGVNLLGSDEDLALRFGLYYPRIGRLEYWAGLPIPIPQGIQV